MGLIVYPSSCDGEVGHTVFSLEMNAQEAPEIVHTNAEEPVVLNKDCIVICADDDKGPRLCRVERSGAYASGGQL